VNASKYLLDTNVVSEWARPSPEPSVIRWLAEVDEDRVFLSVVTLAELEKGVRLLPEGDKRERLAQWLAGDLLDRFQGRILDVTPDIGREWGEVSAVRQRAGRPIGALDAFFAATTRMHDLTLVTRNDRDFEGTGVRLLNPWTG
jgi:predicted nucleic acid-binding protein